LRFYLLARVSSLKVTKICFYLLAIGENRALRIGTLPYLKEYFSLVFDSMLRKIHPVRNFDFLVSKKGSQGTRPQIINKIKFVSNDLKMTVEDSKNNYANLSYKTGTSRQRKTTPKYFVRLFPYS